MEQEKNKIFYFSSLIQNSKFKIQNFFCPLWLIALCGLMASCAGRTTVAPGTLSSMPVQSPASQEIKGERKTIVASWYGPDFHGKPTSSGELFNMYALTCAHREYPFGTRLLVTNPRNNKEVECVVNDRGPFVAGRDLDLSYAAAKKIDIIGPGTAAVIIEPEGRDMRYVKYVKYDVRGPVVTIQVASFRDESNANRLGKALELQYSGVYIITADIDGTKYYRVRIGKFTAGSKAAELGKTLADEGYNVLITKFEQQI